MNRNKPPKPRKLLTRSEKDKLASAERVKQRASDAKEVNLEVRLDDANRKILELYRESAEKKESEKQEVLARKFRAKTLPVLPIEGERWPMLKKSAFYITGAVILVLSWAVQSFCLEKRKGDYEKMNYLVNGLQEAERDVKAAAYHGSTELLMLSLPGALEKVEPSHSVLNAICVHSKELINEIYFSRQIDWPRPIGIPGYADTLEKRNQKIYDDELDTLLSRVVNKNDKSAVDTIMLRHVELSTYHTTHYGNIEQKSYNDRKAAKEKVDAMSFWLFVAYGLGVALISTNKLIEYTREDRKQRGII